MTTTEQHAATPAARFDTGEREQSPAPRSALFGWVMVDWALQPFYTLILTFLFAPYFTSVVVGNPAQGQALWGYAAATAGVLIAVGSPLLGAWADGHGGRKKGVFLCAVVLATSMACLWWAKPNADTGLVLLVLLGFVMATAAAEFLTVFTNAIMPTLAPKDQLGRLSGMSWAVGYTGGLVSLILLAGLLVANPATGTTLLGLQPLITLDMAQREGDRLVGPFAAVWLILFLLPFFLLVPDRRVVKPAGERSAFAELGATLRSLPSHRDMLWFLIARAIYTDGLSAIFVFGGIYGTAIFGWQAFELGVFGIVLIVAGIIGALIGGRLDDSFGAKRVILGALVLLIIGASGILSVSRDAVLFTLPVAAKVVGSAPFSSTGEQVFLAFAVLVALASAPNQSASRSLLARLAPPDKMTQYFGLFAFSGKVTAFLAPLLVAAVTQVSGDQRIGMAAILLFLVAGALLLLPVREPRGKPAGGGTGTA